MLLNDIGPELAPEGLAAIMTYLGIPPKARTFPEVAAALKARMGAGLPGARRRALGGAGAALVRPRPTAASALTYDPRLRDAFEAAVGEPAADLWPLFDALEGVPLAVVRGANSDLLTAETLARMRERRPDLIVAEVPDRGHVPFLDEPDTTSMSGASSAFMPTTW